MPQPLHIAATGLVCAVGLYAEAACAAMRAGIAGFEEVPYADNRGEPIVGAPVPMLATAFWKKDRLVDLLAMALKDCLRDPLLEPLDQVPLFVGLAEPEHPGGGADLASTIIGAMEHELGVRFHPKYSQAVPAGHTAGFRAIGMARHLIEEQLVPACLVLWGGFLHQRAVAALARRALAAEDRRELGRRDPRRSRCRRAAASLHAPDTGRHRRHHRRRVRARRGNRLIRRTIAGFGAGGSFPQRSRRGRFADARGRPAYLGRDGRELRVQRAGPDDGPDDASGARIIRHLALRRVHRGDRSSRRDQPTRGKLLCRAKALPPRASHDVLHQRLARRPRCGSTGNMLRIQGQCRKFSIT